MFLLSLYVMSCIIIKINVLISFLLPLFSVSILTLSRLCFLTVTTLRPEIGKVMYEDHKQVNSFFST